MITFYNLCGLLKRRLEENLACFVLFLRIVETQNYPKEKAKFKVNTIYNNANVIV